MQNTYKQHCSAPLLVVHLGVDAKASRFKLEHTAYNHATFFVPDVDGYQPLKALITDNMELDAPLHSALPLKQVVGTMGGSMVLWSVTLVLTASMKQFAPGLVVSEDPGACAMAANVHHAPRRPVCMQLHVLYVAVLSAAAGNECASAATCSVCTCTTV